MAAETKPKQNTGPNAAYVLLTAISRAVYVGVRTREGRHHRRHGPGSGSRVG